MRERDRKRTTTHAVEAGPPSRVRGAKQVVR